MIGLGRIQWVENWGDQSVTRPRFKIDDRFTGFVYLKLSQSSNVSKRVNCLSFQTCIASSAVPICGKFSGGTVLGIGLL